MSRIRVVMLIESLATGGAEIFTTALASSLDRRRFDVTVCVTRHDGVMRTQELVDAGVRVLRLNRRHTAAVGAWAPLMRLVRRESTDILHGHMFGSNAWAAVLGKLMRVPVVVATEHSWSYQGKPLRKLIDGRVIGRLASAFVAVSPVDAKRMVEIERVPVDKVRLIETSLPRPGGAAGRDGARFRRDVDIPEAVPLVGCVAALVPTKALHILLEAFVLVRRDVPDAHLVVAGEGPERASLQAHADRLGLSRFVRLSGLRSDVPDLLDACDVFALSSDNEGSPLAVIEAMDAGCAVVATRVGGVPHLLDQGAAGVLVPRRDAGAMGRGISELLRDPEAAHALGSRARKRVAAVYTLEHATRRWETLYEELVGAVR